MEVELGEVELGDESADLTGAALEERQHAAHEALLAMGGSHVAHPGAPDGDGATGEGELTRAAVAVAVTGRSRLRTALAPGSAEEGLDLLLEEPLDEVLDLLTGVGLERLPERAGGSAVRWG